MISMDHELFEWINGFVGTWAWFDNTMKLLISDFFLPVLIGAAAWLMWFVGRDARERLANQLGFIYAGVGAGFANLFIRLINTEFDRSRPFLALDDVAVLFYRPTDPSFPSNASAYAFAMAAGVFMANKPMGAAIAVAALLFSFARVYGGMHFPADVLGGALIGILTTLLFVKVLSLCQPVVTFAFDLLRRVWLA